MEAPKNKPKKKPKVSEMTKEQITRALENKRKSNAKAQLIVENLLEKNISESYFLECLYDINKSHFEDIIEERSITHICGYPLCDKSISEKDIPKQKYRISVRQNKVYDITWRKNFCSNICYHSAMYVKNQMFETPLWYREYEDTPTFHLMSADTDPNMSSCMGQEIDVSIIEKVDVSEPPSFTSINDFARASLHEIVRKEETNDEHSKSPQQNDVTQASLHVMEKETNDEHSKSPQENDVTQASLHVMEKETNDEHPDEHPKSPQENDVTQASLHVMEKETNDEHSKSPQENDITQASLHVMEKETNDEHSKSPQENAVTQATLHEIDKKTNDEHSKSQKENNNGNKEISAEEKKRLDMQRYNYPVLKIQGSKLKPGIMGEVVEWPVYEHDPFYIKDPIVKTNSPKRRQKGPATISSLNIEVEESLAEWFTLDTMIFLFGEEKMREMATDKRECFKEYMYNYSKSRFYKSNNYDTYLSLCRKLNMLEIEDRKLDPKAIRRGTKPLPDYTMIQEESKRMQLKVVAYLDGKTEVPEPLPEHNTSNEDKGLTQLPLLDKTSQNALRRRIIYQHLNKVLPDLLRSLGMLGFSVNTEVRLIVKTFKLSAHNIMFKPIQWTLISILLLKLLALRDQQLQYKLEEPLASQHMNLLLLSYNLDGGYIDRLIYWLSDIDRLLGTNSYDDSVD